MRCETSAGGVVYRRTDAGFEVVLAEQRDRLTGERNTRLPKGIVELDEIASETAVREVEEEIGVVARIIAPLDIVEYEYVDSDARVRKTVHFFLMERVSGDPHPRDGEMQGAAWCPIEAAPERLSFETEQVVMRAALGRLSAEP